MASKKSGKRTRAVKQASKPTLLTKRSTPTITQLPVARVEDSIEAPAIVLALNLAKLKADVPPLADLWNSDYGFYMVSFNLSFVTQRGLNCVRGVRLARITGKFDDQAVSVIDVLPKTEWVESNLSADAHFTIDPSGIFGKFVPVPTGASAGLTLKYSWNPKRARMISSGAGTGVHWYSERAKNEFLDGNYQVSITFIRPLIPESQRIKLKLEIWLIHDIRLGRDEEYKTTREIELRIK